MRGAGGIFAGLAGLIGAGICLAAELVLAIVLPDESLLAIGGGSGLSERTLAQTVSFSQVDMSSEGFGVRTVPVLFVLIPILGVATGVAASAPRTSGMPVQGRLLWAAAAGVPFAILMAFCAVIIGEIDFDPFASRIEFSFGMVLLLSSVWGSLGGVLGMLFALRKGGETVPNPLSPRGTRFARIGWSALGPLLLALAVVGVLGTVAWVAQVDRESFPFSSGSHWVATGEQLAYAGDHAINILPLGAGANERVNAMPSLPISPANHSEHAGDPSFGSSPTSNLFDYEGTMPTLLFLLALVVLIGVPALLALYAGFAVVRRVGESRTDRAAAWGALVGPVWSLTMVLLTTLARKDVVGNPSGDSVLIAFLLGGAALGAVGGILASRRSLSYGR